VSDPRRGIPSVDRLLEAPVFGSLLERYSRARVADGVRREVERVRASLSAGVARLDMADPVSWARAVEADLLDQERPSVRSVLNGTGVILHTNLGRAPLARAAVEAMARVGEGYSNVEYDLEAGGRGSRYTHCAGLLQELTGAEAALVVNNNAAALVLALNTLALGRSVLVSRGELVEIGGSFRVPDILERSGARLREVGSTNRTRLEDFRRALDADVGAILKVHRSNFRITGFTEEVGVTELSALAAEHGVPLVHDLGSGLLFESECLRLLDEPTVGQSVREGSDVVCFSGDKLLGGPQAGVLLGRRTIIDRMRTNPLCRALRVDKVTLAGLEATLRLYRDPELAAFEVPVLALLLEPAGQIESRAHRLAERISRLGLSAEALPGVSVVGGGTCPGIELPSWTVRLDGGALGAEALARRLRRTDPPVIARLEDGRLVLDLRTLRARDEDALLSALTQALEDARAPGRDG